VRKKKTFRGCTGTSSFAIGHGDKAVHGRFMYWVSREDRRAAGFAELGTVSRLRVYTSWDTYCARFWFVDKSTVASSLMRWGLLPVFSSCSMTEITTSSLMPSRSIFRYATTSPGDGGGVWAPALVWTGCGFEAARSEEGVRRGEGSGDGLSCSLLTRLVGGAASRETCSGESGFDAER